MRLEIFNFAKIDYADLKFDGITVIAGENNTGKTTVGKVLYSIFNSLYDLEGQVDRQRDNEIRNICSRYLRSSLVLNSRVSDVKRQGTSVSSRIFDEIFTSITDNICNICNLYPEEFTIETLTNIIDNIFSENNLSVNESLKGVEEELFNKLLNVVKIDRWKVALELVYQFFDQTFASQFKSLKDETSDAKIVLSIKDHSITIELKANSIMIDDDINIMHEAYLIDDPFVIDDLRSRYFYLGHSRKNVRPRDFLVSKLRTFEDNVDSVFDTVYAKEKINEILEIVNAVVPGEISSTSGKWTLSSVHYHEPVDFYNLSAGLKSFVVIKMLLEKSILKEKDVLILDEPEIHLHPEWQLKYAEIIVLLQKMFDLNIVVTTHSRDFFEAIDLYSQKHKISDKCNYYLAKQLNGISSFEDVTCDKAKIYRQLIDPSRLLDKLKFELEDEEDE